MKNRINILGLALAAIIGFAMTACDDGLAGNKGSDPADDLTVNPLDIIGGDSIDESALGNYSYTINLPAGEPYISRLLGWQWGIPSDDEYDFKWAFYNDGTIPMIHCCGYTEKNEFYRYLLCGNVLVTSFGGDIKVNYITIADSDASFTWNGTTYPRRDPDTSAYALAPLRITNANKVLGTWQGADGTAYVFSNDSGLRIGSDQYGYLVVTDTKILTLGPIVDGGKAGLCMYEFGVLGNKLKLKFPDGSIITLTRSE